MAPLPSFGPPPATSNDQADPDSSAVDVNSLRTVRENLMSRVDEFDVVIRRGKGKVVARIPQLGLYATGDDIPTALATLEQKRTALLADLADAGGLEDIEVRPYAVRMGSGRDDIRQFALKAVIVVALITVALFVSGALVASRFERAAQKLTRVGGGQFWSKVERGLERAADPAHDLPPEKKQKMLSQVRVIVERWRPFVVEASALFAEPPKAKQQEGARSGR
jgi:hypothetical protein